MKKLIRDEQGQVYVMVSHDELGGLIARLMHIAELNSDKEYRNALKGEMKMVSRNWLDDLYYDVGYADHDYDSTKVVDINK